MHLPKFLLPLLSFLTLHYSLCAANTGNSTQHFDILIYGGTSSGAIAAIAAARSGKKVALIEPSAHIGGMTTGGLGAVDFGTSSTIGGITLEYFDRLEKIYGEKSRFKTTPKTAEALFRKLLSDAGVSTFLNSRIREHNGTSTANSRIQSITLENNGTFTAQVFIDATYEGDLLAQTGVSHIIGRESQFQYNESAAGVRELRGFGRASDALDENGQLLPDIVRSEIPILGSADNKTQSYNFRLCLTQNAKTLVPFTKPANYNPKRYALLKKSILSTRNTRQSLDDFVSLQKLPEQKLDANNKGWISTDLVNASWPYPNATYANRQKIHDDHRTYTEGLLYFLSHDPDLPEALRNDVRSYGYAKDEFTDNKHFPHQLYIREARRLVGEYVMTQKDVQTEPTKPDAVAIGSYMLDVHWTQKFLAPDNKIYLEGLLGPVGHVPYQIPYRSLLPQKSECQNLLVPVCISASHVVYSSARMEPVYMMLGHAAGIAAAQSIDEQKPLHEINVPALQKTLSQQNQILTLPDDSILLRKGALPGIIADDSDAEFTGTWISAANARPYFHEGYRTAPPMKKGDSPSTATFTLRIPRTDTYSLEIFYSANPNRSTNAPLILRAPGINKTYRVNMRESSGNNFTPVATDLLFKAGDTVQVILTNQNTKGYIVADAIRLLPQNPPEGGARSPSAPFPQGTSTTPTSPTHQPTPPKRASDVPQTSESATLLRSAPPSQQSPSALAPTPSSSPSDYSLVTSRYSQLDGGSTAPTTVDDTEATFTGPWQNSANGTPIHGSSFRFTPSQNKSGEISTATYKLKAPAAGAYSFQIIFAPHTNRATNAPVIILKNGKTRTFTLNLRENPDNGFTELAKIQMQKNEELTVTLSNENANGFVVADALRLVPLTTTGTSTQSAPIEGEVKNTSATTLTPPKIQPIFHTIQSLLANTTGTSTTLGTPKQPDANVAQAAKPAPLTSQPPAPPPTPNGAAAPSSYSLVTSRYSLLDGGSAAAIISCADRILSRILPDGAINNANNPNSVLIIPYFSNYCAIALLRAYELTRDTRYLDASRNSIRWYLSHLQPDGTIHDYKGGSFPNYKDSGTYDSADSYPATLALALWLDYRITGDSTFLQETFPGLLRAMKAVDELRNPDSLTYAKRDYKIKYFMDNIEVLHGLIATVKIAKTIDPTANKSLIKNYTAWANGISTALQNYYDSKTGFFRFAKNSLDTERLYPGALTNIFAVLFTLSDTGTSTTLFDYTYSRFSSQLTGNSTQQPQLLAWFALAAQHTGNSTLARQILSIADSRDKTQTARTHYYALKLLTLSNSTTLF